MTIKNLVRKIIPPFFLSFYHYLLAFIGALIFGFPSRKLVVIGVTGTSGKSTTVDFITRILEENGNNVASLSSIRFKIGKREWKNELKMTMPGRFTIQKFLRQAVNEKCKYAVLEVTSEGIKQFRHKFINFDTAVFLNISPEHLESHGGMENYRNEKLKLFKATSNTHVINIENEHSEYFLKIPAKKTITFGLEKGDVNKQNTPFHLNILGQFNEYNALAALAVAQSYHIPLEVSQRALQKVQGIPGRMEIVSQHPLVVVDYAHTPVQLESAYRSLSNWTENPKSEIRNPKLICVLGSCGGGRDTWKRPVLGEIAAKYCKEIIITNEDPYDEDPLEIMEKVAEGIGEKPHSIVLDRKEAIKKAISLANPQDTVIITGKGSEPLMCLENGKKIPWDDRQIAREALAK